MPVKPRGGSYEATIHNKGQRFRKTFPTRTEAEAWELRAKAQLLKGESIEEGEKGSNGVSTLSALRDLTYKRYWAGKGGEKSSMINSRKCLDKLGWDMPPSRVNETLIDDMIFSFEAEGLSDSTINRRISALSKMLTFAAERGYIARRPKMERKKEPENRIRYITPEEEKRMHEYFRHIGRDDMSDLVVVATDTGLRIGELIRIEGRDINEKVLSIWRTKNGRARSVPLTERASEVLERRSGEPTDLIFGEWNHSRIRHYWDLCRRHMGFATDNQFVPHAMRHTFCSRLVQRGVDIVTISKLAGHSSITVTMRYAHLAPNNLTDAIKALEIPKDSNPQDGPQPL